MFIVNSKLRLVLYTYWSYCEAWVISLSSDFWKHWLLCPLQLHAALPMTDCLTYLVQFIITRSVQKQHFMSWDILQIRIVIFSETGNCNKNMYAFSQQCSHINDERFNIKTWLFYINYFSRPAVYRTMLNWPYICEIV